MSLDWLREPLFNLWHQAFQLISLTKSAIFAALSCDFSFARSQETKQNEQFPGAKNASSSVNTYWDISVYHIHSLQKEYLAVKIYFLSLNHLHLLQQQEEEALHVYQLHGIMDCAARWKVLFKKLIFTLELAPGHVTVRPSRQELCLDCKNDTWPSGTSHQRRSDAWSCHIPSCGQIAYFLGLSSGRWNLWISFSTCCLISEGPLLMFASFHF